jgi:hypothetical protein
VVEWLVPVSRYTRFTTAAGRVLKPSFATLQEAALADRIERIVCDVRGPLVDIRAGDQVWCYTPELEVGVFAVGRARRPTATKKPTVTVAVDRGRTRVFASDPLPAAVVRRWVPELRQGAVPLMSRPRALTVLDGWQRERAERDAELLTPLRVTPWRKATRASGDDQPARDPVIGPIARLLRSQDFALGLAPISARRRGLVARRVREVVVIDVQRIRATKGREEALAALGPLREFRWRFERDPRDLRLRGSLWMAFTAKPHDEVVDFLEDEQVLVSWPQRTGFVELTDRSKQHWYQYLGVR